MRSKALLFSIAQEFQIPPMVQIREDGSRILLPPHEVVGQWPIPVLMEYGAWFKLQEEEQPSAPGKGDKHTYQFK